MLSFLQYKNFNTLNETANTHSTHFDELIFTQYSTGTAKAIAAVNYIIKEIGTTSSKSISPTSIKIDGAPAIVAGWIDNKFFVASKSLFNKEPKINFTSEDIKNNHEGGIVDKLEKALKYLKPIIPKGKIFQGDFLFDTESRKIESIDGKEYYTYHPNTIKYAVPVNTPIGKEVGNAKFGIIFHTEYSSDGTDPKSINLKGFNVTEKQLGKSPNVWCTDAMHKDVGKLAAFSIDEKKHISSLCKNVLSLSKSINWANIKSLGVNPMTFTNTFIRDNKVQPHADMKAKLFIEWIKEKAKKDVDSKKSDKGKATAQEKWNSIISNIDEKSLHKAYEIQEYLINIKEIIIKKLEEIKHIKTFIQKSDGSISSTKHEGYVFTKIASGVKLVDRYDFSRNNFSPDIIKGWTK